MAVSSAAVFLVGIFHFQTNGQTPQRPGRPANVVDSMLATVNGSLITYSDLLWQLTLEPGTSLDNPSS
ncbi:MAG TPA: hypothetical protein VJV03_09555, partial [Pyrinomonadaceae bacterium]|nr:hypothetical protein [Pyrinomonadaceae bacterium]